ncbi:MAG: hypothetical protein OEO84_00025 [Betaproteobacteria bacterium]|nr:hypothetical protein [Betaproteobacteria bacterium]
MPRRVPGVPHVAVLIPDLSGTGCGWEGLPQRCAASGARPGLILFEQTFGDLANFNPYVHVLAADIRRSIPAVLDQRHKRATMGG